MKKPAVKGDVYPETFPQKILNIIAVMHKVGEKSTERKLTDTVIDKLIPEEHNRVRFKYTRDPIILSIQIQNSIRHTWIRAVQP